MSATLLPVLVKCCVLSKQQPRMCQPSRLTLPNGLLNADIKLTRSFTLLFSSLAFRPFTASAACPLSLPLLLTPSLTLSLTCPVPVFLLRCFSLYQPLTSGLSCVFLSDISFNWSTLTSEVLLQVVSLFTIFFS